MKRPSLVIVSGGAESVSLGIVEALWRCGLSYAVISLVRGSLLKGLPGCVDFSEVNLGGESTPGEAAEALLVEIRRLRACVDEPLPVFPTEDDGLRLLSLLRGKLDGVAEFSRMRALEMGGLDKAELFASMESAGLAAFGARTVVLRSLVDLESALDVLGNDIIVKPCFKPWRESVGKSGLKVLASVGQGGGVPDLRRELARVWPLADTWVAQERLFPMGGGERSVCIVRSDVVRGCEVLERSKYPSAGGSAVWVRSKTRSPLFETARTIAEALDLQGICELSFLEDHLGRPRLLELNTRPWLQMDLVEKSGYPIVLEGMRALRGLALSEADGIIKERDWVQPERALLAWISGDSGPRLKFLRQMLRVFASHPVYSVYSNSMPGVRRGWMLKILKKALVPG